MRANALLAVGAAALLAAGLPRVAPAATAIGGCSIPAAAPQPAPALEASVLSLVNAHRTSMGLGQLSVSSALTASAEWKASHMATFGYFDHSDLPTGGFWPSPARGADDRMLTCGFTSPYIGENIAWNYASPADVVAGWLASTGHRENIENPSFSLTGVGVAFGSTGSYWVQDFGGGLVAASLAAQVRGVTASVTARGVLVRWRTASETETAGFRVFREVNGRRLLTAKRFVAARGTAAGHGYSLLDRHAGGAARRARYWLQAVGLDGAKRWYGPARVVR